MRRMEFGVLATVVFAVGACSVAPPTGPDVAVMPGKDKTLEAFQADDAACKQYAPTQIGYEIARGSRKSKRRWKRRARHSFRCRRGCCDRCSGR